MARYELDSRTYVAGGPETDEAEQAPSPEAVIKACTPLADQLTSQGMLPADGSAGNIFEIMDPSKFRYVQSLYRDENLEMFKAIVCLSMYRYAADYLDSAAWAKAHDGEELSPRQAAFDYMLRHTRFLTEQAYADAYIFSETCARVKELAEECRQALADRMRRCEWISEETRTNAVKKAETIEVVIVTPEERTDFSPLLKALSRENISLLDAVIQCDAMERQMMLRLAGKPYDRAHRFFCTFSMLSANALYEPGKNTFYIMAGAIKPEFCDFTSRETLLGTLGQTIAHEMSHGYETYGVEYDWDGSRNGILSEEDRPKFRERVQRMTESMNRIELADGTMLDGARTFFEAAADLNGLKVVLDMAKKTEGFDYGLFFRTLARKLYRYFPTRDDVIGNYASDFHPAHFVRCNFIFAQVDEFYTACPSVQKGTEMYCAPEDRVSLW